MDDPINVPERIILCVDVCGEVDSLEFAGNKKSPTRLDAIKNGLRLFVQAKLRINPQHQFGLMLLTTVAEWYCEPSSDAELLVRKINALHSVGAECAECNLSTVFDLLLAKFADLSAPIDAQPSVAAAAAGTSDAAAAGAVATRVVLFYARSSVVPQYDGASVARLLQPPHERVTVDGVYVHAKPSASNRPQQVYDALTELEGSRSYFFENSISLKKFNTSLTQLLAHPLQRPEQNLFKSRLSLA
eukprot:TRINITY_DN3939_c0_g1_i2.p1 TRINITY_DN3939_c0_g1~~TRINITY_DN3939_c0_g1_i2.p1  ORF type:complete len:245 (-),score=69.44 TRINITY_DN3939_c0_g1_i2:269-1003(-)